VKESQYNYFKDRIVLRYEVSTSRRPATGYYVHLAIIEFFVVFVYSSPSINSTSTWNGSVFLSITNIPTVRVVAPESFGIQPADHPINWKSKSLKPISYDLKLILNAPPTHNLSVGGAIRIALHLPELICQWDFFLPHHSTSHTS